MEIVFRFCFLSNFIVTTNVYIGIMVNIVTLINIVSSKKGFIIMIVIVIKGKGVLYCKEYKIVFDYLSNSALLVQAILFVCFQPWLYFPSVILSSAFQIHFLPPNPPSFLFDLLSILLPPLTHQ